MSHSNEPTKPAEPAPGQPQRPQQPAGPRPGQAPRPDQPPQPQPSQPPESVGVARDKYRHPEAVTEARAVPKGSPPSDDMSADDPALLDDPVALPMVVLGQLDGGYVVATISQAQDPNAPNIAELVKVRTVIAVEAELLQPRIMSCLISEYGLTQEQAESIEPVIPALPAVAKGRPAHDATEARDRPRMPVPPTGNRGEHANQPRHEA